MDWKEIKVLANETGNLRVVVSRLPLPKPQYSIAIRRERDDESMTAHLPVRLRGAERRLESQADAIYRLVVLAERFIADEILNEWPADRAPTGPT